MAKRKISIGTFDCRVEDIEAVVSAMKSGMLSVGEELTEFESKVARFHNKKHGVMVNSGQSALEAALELAKVTLGVKDLKVICPALTYAATLWAILRTGCTPLLCDIDESYNLDWNKVGELEADVVLAVDLCGKAVHPSLGQRLVIEDACEAFGNKNCGYGDIVCFSFYVSHIITTGSGGMLCVDEERDGEWLKSFISHGRVYGGDFTKFTRGWIDRFKFDKVGASYRSDNMAAALGLSQFQRIDEIVEIRKRNAKHLIDLYSSEGSLQDYLVFPDLDYYVDSVFQFFPIMIRGTIDRDELLMYLYAKGIDSRVLLSLTNQIAVKNLYGEIESKYPMAQKCNDRGFIVGCHQNLGLGDMEYIIEVLRDFLK